MNERKRGREKSYKRGIISDDMESKKGDRLQNFRDILRFISDFHTYYIHFKNIFCT